MSITSSKLFIEANVCSIDNRASEFRLSWPVDDFCQVFNEFPNLLKDLSASATVTGTVQNTRRPKIVLLIFCVNRVN